MSKVILVTNPCHDTATYYLDAWVTEALSKITTENIEIIELKKENVNKDNLEKIIEEKNPELILFHGHGSSNSIMGFEYCVLVQSPEDLHQYKDKIIHSLSCDSGKILGPEIINSGSKAFIGYKEEFKFVCLQEEPDKLNDIVARPCLQPAFEAVTALLQGMAAEEAFERSQSEYKKNLFACITNGLSNETVKTVASYIFHNQQNQVYLTH